MIFSVGDHIEQIIAGTKTQTRRKSGWYIVGKTYAIQPCRTCKVISEGRILITDKRAEWRHDNAISESDAQAEGGYTPLQFEDLYLRMDRGWSVRYAYTFSFIPPEGGGGGHVSRERYILAAFSIHQRKAIKYSEYVTLQRMAKGSIAAMEGGADFVLLRRIGPEVGRWRPKED